MIRIYIIQSNLSLRIKIQLPYALKKENYVIVRIYEIFMNKKMLTIVFIFKINLFSSIFQKF